MRFLFLFLWGWSQLAWSAEALTPSQIEPRAIQIRNTGAPDVALLCPRKGPTSVRPLASPPTPTEIPDEDEVATALEDARVAGGSQPARPFAAWPSTPHGWRIAVWGDSHMAAAFFSDQLQRKLAPADAAVSSRFVHAGVGHGGVRGLVRKTCLSGDWSREMAYAHADAASAPGPGMTSLVAKRPGATLALDMRDSQGQARHTSLQLLYHGEGAGNTQLAVSVDGESETLVSLDPQAGPGALALQTTAPLSTLKIRVVEGAFRFQGIKLSETTAPAGLHMDLFAYPGATAAGWVRSDLRYLASWFTDQSYDLALIAFGTNEGNDPRFNEAAYRDMLTGALGHFRQVFPQTQCVLIGPGDRGIRVVKSKGGKARKKQAASSKLSKNTPHKSAQNNTSVQSSAPAKAPNNLLKFGRIHHQIGQIQAEVAALHGCSAWSMQTAMGGVGSAYPWARKNPPLMAPDLIHFTPAGYRELANTFLADFGLNPP